MSTWAIKSDVAIDSEDGSPLYWSNADGWVDLASADKYSDDERKALHACMPLSSNWERLPNIIVFKSESPRHRELRWARSVLANSKQFEIDRAVKLLEENGYTVQKPYNHKG
jgi:hypothetical protein